MNASSVLERYKFLLLEWSMRPDDVSQTYPEHRRIQTWEGLRELQVSGYSSSPSEHMRWVFRGDRSDKTFPSTKLDDAFELYGVRRRDQQRCEIETIRAFQREAALYLEHEPDKDDILEWLALMRHYGAPVRLLDCTYSFYLAVYMALAECEKGVVWALNAARFNKPDRVKRRIEAAGGNGRFESMLRRLKRRNDVLNIRSRGDKIVDLAIACYLIENPIPLVYAVNPFRLNRRLTVQHGLLLLAGDPRVSFYENLRSCFTDEEDMRSNVHRIVLDLRKPEHEREGEPERNRVLRALRDMNISNEVLFPGLDGFAKSLSERFVDRDRFPRQ